MIEPDLRGFLHAPANSRTRESLLRHRFACDVLSAAGARGYHMELLTSEVDRDGHDIVLDDRDELRRLQRKSVEDAATTARWEIHRGLLRPSPYTIDSLVNTAHRLLGVNLDPTRSGSSGGVVLQKFAADATRITATEYSYVDAWVIVALGYFAPTRRASCIDLLDRIFDFSASAEKVAVNAGHFVQVNDASSLLALAGLHSIEPSSWRMNLMAVGRAGPTRRELDRAEHAHLETAHQSLAAISPAFH